jgi:hypothetical protein
MASRSAPATDDVSLENECPVGLGRKPTWSRNKTGFHSRRRNLGNPLPNSAPNTVIPAEAIV